MSLLVALSGDGSLHHQVYGALREAILSGRLGPRDRLPPSRALAAELRVSRATIVSAYDQLAAEGYAVGRQGAGTFVAAALPETPPVLPGAPRGRGEVRAARPHLSGWAQRLPQRLPRWRTPIEPPHFDFQYGRPGLVPFPQDVWRRLAARRARSGAATDYPPVQGLAELREAVAAYLGRARALACAPEQILITTGSQQGLELVARVLVEPGDGAALEEPHYAGARIALQAAGARLVGVRVDRQGLDTDALEVCERDVRLVYVTPSHQFPTGAVLPLGRRLALLRWASRRGAFVVEDDYDSEFRYSGTPHPALAGLDAEGRVIYAGTFSKVLHPALRLGYLVLPPALVDVFRRAKAVCDGGSSPLEQPVLADFLSGGHFERHLRRARKAGAERRDSLLRALAARLPDAEIQGGDAGLHVLVWPAGLEGREADAAVRRAAEKRVAVQSASPFYLSRPRRGGLLVGWSAIATGQIRAGIARLADALASA